MRPRGLSAFPLTPVTDEGVDEAAFARAWLMKQMNSEVSKEGGSERGAVEGSAT